VEIAAQSRGPAREGWWASWLLAVDPTLCISQWPS